MKTIAHPDGFTFANDRFYVGDRVDDKVYAYWVNGARDSDWDFDLRADNGLVRGIAYADRKMYMVDETDEKVYVYGLRSEPDGPDLIVGSASTNSDTPEAGGVFALRTTVRNRGNRQASGLRLRFYRSTDAVISAEDTELGSDDLGSLRASAMLSRSANLTAPTQDGCYYCGACVDGIEGESATREQLLASC